MFIGSKMFVAGMMEWEKFPAGISLGMNFGMLAAASRRYCRRLLRASAQLIRLARQSRSV